MILISITAISIAIRAKPSGSGSSGSGSSRRRRRRPSGLTFNFCEPMPPLGLGDWKHSQPVRLMSGRLDSPSLKLRDAQLREDWTQKFQAVRGVLEGFTPQN